MILYNDIKMSCTRRTYLSFQKIEWISNDGKNDPLIPIHILAAIQECQQRSPVQVTETKSFVLLPDKVHIDFLKDDLIRERIKRQSKIDDNYIDQNTYIIEVTETIMKTRNNGFEPILVRELDESRSWCLFVTDNSKFVCWATGRPHSLFVKESNTRVNVDQYIAYVLVDIKQRGKGYCPMMIDIIFSKFKDQGVDTVGILNAAEDIGQKCYLHGKTYYDFECLEADNKSCVVMKFKLRHNK
jgi:hypothetical protein